MGWLSLLCIVLGESPDEAPGDAVSLSASVMLKPLVGCALRTEKIGEDELTFLDHS